MFDCESAKESKPVDYTGLKLAAIGVPIFFLITFLYNEDAALAAYIVLGTTVFAIKSRWKLRKHIWFWAIIAILLALHVPLVLVARWPQGHMPARVYAMPIGIADFFIIRGAIGLAEKFFSKGSSDSDEKE